MLREQPGVENADLSGALLTGFGPADRTRFDGANLYPAVRTNALFGKPNYLVAHGANVNAEGMPSACVPPL